MSIEQFLENITLEEIEQLKKLKELELNKIPTYSFSKITFNDLENIFDIKQNIRNINIFNKWFCNDIKLSKENIQFLNYLINRNINLMKLYNEEDLKVNFIIPLLNNIDFFLLEDNIRSFTNEKLTYKTDKFILNGEVDFIFSEGIRKAEKPYFFIKEFKKSIQGSDPEPQLIAELISAIELNNWTTIKGAYIVGAIWNFVILEKLGKDKYQYYISSNFDSTKIEDLKDIYKNLTFVKNEIIDMIKRK